jgi:hypothetical protein
LLFPRAITLPKNGTHGASAYLAEVIYNLTEITGVDFVNFRFNEGEHAAPGTYSRTDFVSQYP